MVRSYSTLRLIFSMHFKYLFLLAIVRKFELNWYDIDRSICVTSIALIARAAAS